MLLHVCNDVGLPESFHQTGGENGIGLSQPRDRIYGQYVAYLFKWIKQNLKIKSFVGTSKNAVLTQIWIALCVYLLLAYLKFQSKLNKSMQQILRLLQLNLFEKRDLMALLRGDPPRDNHLAVNQMALL
jgi:putative transposase